MVFQALEKHLHWRLENLTGLGKKAAVLAVDPSNVTISHSILGDKTEWRN
jgi:putative protein kinase ArgK-like GTPase of G3E family